MRGSSEEYEEEGERREDYRSGEEDPLSMIRASNGQMQSERGNHNTNNYIHINDLENNGDIDINPDPDPNADPDADPDAEHLREDPVALQITPEEFVPEGDIKDPWILGSCLAFGYSNHQPRFTIGPHWPMYICLNTFALGIAIVVIKYLMFNVSKTGTIMGILITLFYFISYTLTFIMNPGIADRTRQFSKNYIRQLPSKKKKKYCSRCKIAKKDETEHCEDCDLCIEEYDHHCPWTGKCIGRGNKVYFYMFITAIMILIMYIMVGSIFCWYLHIFCNSYRMHIDGPIRNNRRFRPNRSHKFQIE